MVAFCAINELKYRLKVFLRPETFKLIPCKDCQKKTYKTKCHSQT